MQTDQEKPLVAKIGSAKTLERLANGIPDGQWLLLEAIFPDVFKEWMHGRELIIPHGQSPIDPISATLIYRVYENLKEVKKERKIEFVPGICPMVY